MTQIESKWVRSLKELIDRRSAASRARAANARAVTRSGRMTRVDDSCTALAVPGPELMRLLGNLRARRIKCYDSVDKHRNTHPANPTLNGTVSLIREGKPLATTNSCTS